MITVKSFIQKLNTYHSPQVFNPWCDYNENYDIPHAPQIRTKQLETYLTRRIGHAKILLIAEACGYQGGHFSGIAMTCERMILNEHKSVNSFMILGTQGQRTSRQDSPYITKTTQKEKGFNEPTDTVVWSAALNVGLLPEEFLLWNIFPFHPYKSGNMLSNRTPDDEELATGLTYTKELLKLFPVPLIFAVGKKSEKTLIEAGYKVIGLRHPANGGANIFKTGLQNALLKN